MSDSDSRPVPPGNKKLAALAQSMQATADMAGVPAPELTALEPRQVDLQKPVHELCAHVSQLLRSGRFGLYRRGEEIGTIDEGTGTWQKMDAHRFRSWLFRSTQFQPVGRWKATKDKEGSPCYVPEPGEMDLRQAETILRSDDMRITLPVVERIHMVKLPVYRAAPDEREEPRRRGYQKLELLQPGYDAASKTFTVRGGLDYPEDMPLEEAKAFLQQLFKYFEWGAGGGMAIQVAAMFTLFARLIFRGKAPMFLLNANQVGSGKSQLAKLILWAVYGHADAGMSDIDQRDKFREELNSRAQVFAPYAFFDDVDIGNRPFRSSDLNRWLTSATWWCRVLGGSGFFSGPLYAVTLMTANKLNLSPDLQRRTLIVDLFAHYKSDDRVLPGDVILLDEKFFSDEERRKQVLSALWSILHAWDDADRPDQAPKQKPLASFEGWSAVIPAIVEFGELGNALQKFDAPDAGDVVGREFEKLVRGVIREFVAGKDQVVVTLAQVIGVARRHGLFSDLWPRGVGSIEDVLETEGERKGGFKVKENTDAELGGLSVDVTEEEKRLQASEWLNQSIRSGWGKKFRKVAADGRYFRADNGDVYSFGDRGATSSATSYTLKRVRER